MIALEAKASFWDAVTAWSALAVFVGVAAECVAEFKTLAKWFWLRTDRAVSITSKCGLLLLTAALAVEVLAAIESHDTNEKIVSALNSELNATIKQASNLEKLTKTLGLSNDALRSQVSVQSDLLNKTGGALNILSKQSANFEKTIRTQEASNNADLASLKGDAAKLAEARNEILANAGKSAEAAAAATKAQADMTTALNAVQTMRQRLQEIITPRQIDDPHFARIVEALRKFPKTPVDFAITRDPEAADLVVRISDALVAAGWDIQPCVGNGFGLNASSRPKLPQMCELTTRGVQVTVAREDLKTLQPAGDAFLAAMQEAGILAAGQNIPAKLDDGAANPNAVKPGMMHIMIGAKP